MHLPGSVARILFSLAALFMLTGAATGPNPAVEPAALPNSGEPGPQSSGCGGAAPAASNAAYEQQVVELVNAERLTNGGLAPYKRVETLDSAARYHAADMVQDNYFYHDTYDRSGGNLVKICAWNARVGTFYSGVYGENIAAGYGDPESVMSGWMNSSGHKANILSSSSWEIGVGYASGGSYGSYWVQDFGRRSNIYPLVINREAAQTGDPASALYIYGAWTQMRLKNENGPWSAWRPFQANSAWQLSACAGPKTVTAELQSGATTLTSSDSITLAGIPQALGGLPEEIHFTYSTADGRLYPDSALLTPLNTFDGCPFAWSASKSGSWFSLSAGSGSTASPFTITPDGFNPGAPGGYSGSVTVSGPPGSTGSPHSIAVTLEVTGLPVNFVYLPFNR